MLRSVDRTLCRFEKTLAAFLLLLMVGLMFVNVMREIYGRPEGRLSLLLLALLRRLGTHPRPATIHGPVSEWLNASLAFLLAYAGLRTMRRDSRISWLWALAGAAACAAGWFGAIALILWLFPNGLVWGDHVALACMLWVSLLGASIATHERRHLALELGEKIWPLGLLPWVRALAMLTASVLCGFLLLLAWRSWGAHFATWSKNHLVSAERLGDTWIPVWVVLLIFPYGFSVMTLRFVGTALGLLGPPDEEPAP